MNNPTTIISQNVINVDIDSRKVTLPVNFNLGVMNDNSCKTITFIVQKKSDITDLTDLTFSVNTISAKRTPDKIYCDCREEGGFYIITAVLKGTIFEASGKAVFNLCGQKFDSSHIAIKSWGSEDIIALVGSHSHADKAIEELYPSVLEELRQKVNNPNLTDEQLNSIATKVAEKGFYTKSEIDSMIADVDLSSYQTKTDDTLTTTSKEVVGAINENTSSISELKSDIANLKENCSGLTETSSKLLIKVLRNGLYANDMNKDITALETELGANIISYTITNNLTNATNSNTDTSIKEGFSYSASIVANLGYILSNVTVTMGGTDITSEVYSGGVINIPSVNGDIVITAIAIVSETTMYSITNTFTNVSTDNPNTSVLENSGYVANLTPTDGYLLETVTVTMGGVDITSSAYANGVVTISSVTGNIVITAIASEPISEEVVLLKSLTGDGASYIDTEVLPQKSHRYEISFTLTTDTKSSLFGVDCYEYGSAYYGVYLNNNSNAMFNGRASVNTFGNVGTWNNTEANLLTNKQAYFVMKDGSQKVYLDKNYTTQQSNITNGTSAWGDTDMPPYPMYLFATNVRTSKTQGARDISSHKIYWFKIYDDSTNELLHEFVPSMKGTKIGMLDTVTKKFHENIGTGTFSYEEIEVSE